MARPISLLLLAIFLSLVFSASISSACFNSVDSYATEVLLNNPGIDYNLKILDNVDNVIKSQDSYIFQSEYNKNLAVILSVQYNALSLRLQVPTKEIEKDYDYIKVSSFTKNSLNISKREDIYNEWQIVCDSEKSSQCELRKDNIFITINCINKCEITLEINDQLNSCNAYKSCDGKCVPSIGGLCINKEMKDSIESVLKYSGVIKNFDELFYSYRSDVGKRTIKDLESEINFNVDWKEALKQELVWLRQQNIIHLKNEDIDAISNLAKAGKAGHNSRIVYSDKWMYYYEIYSPSVISTQNCEGFPLSSLPQKAASFPKSPISTYYLIPIFMIIILAIIFLVLILIARKIPDKKEEKDEKEEDEE